MSRTSRDPHRLILASTSAFRRDLLARLGLPFETRSPDIDETPKPGETAPELAARLAELKARAVAAQEPNALVIGSDQVAVLDGEFLGKPGNHAKAFAQLSRASGKSITFFTGLCLIHSDSGRAQVAVEPFQVHLRSLNASQITAYLNREKPYQCAGSLKSEGLGIVLCERLEGHDPTALIGLPLIRLFNMLENEGMSPLQGQD
jgi:septum formation protein